MSPSKTNILLSLYLGLLVLGLAACGGNMNTLEEFHSQSLPEQTAMTAQGEIHEVMQSAQSGILAAVLDAEELETASCKPKLTFAFIGIGFKFNNDGNCKLQGNVLIKLFPLRAQVDLDVVGMTYVDSMSFDADISLSGGNGTKIDWDIVNGRLNLKNFSLLPVDEVILSGRANATIKDGVFTLSSRTNAFDGATGFGVALTSEFGNGNRSIQGCLLTGGSGTDPDAGTTKSCVSLLK